jgi:hypothetical protein
MDNHYLSFAHAISGFEGYTRDHAAALNQEQSDIAGEALNKLFELEDLRKKIIELNGRVLSQDFDPIALLRDKIAEGEIGDHNLIELLQKNPNPQRVQTIAGYTVNNERRAGFPEEKKELRRMTLLYYQTAHMLLKRLRKLPALKTVECTPISVVRNLLMEHPEGRNSKVIFDTFGYSDINGPTVKALRRAGQSDQYPDRGFRVNNNELVAAIVAILAKVRPEAP